MPKSTSETVTSPNGFVLEEAPLLLLVWLESATLTLWLMFFTFGGFARYAAALAVVASGVTLSQIFPFNNTFVQVDRVSRRGCSFPSIAVSALSLVALSSISIATH